MELKPLIKVEALSFGYTEKTVLEDINLAIREGEIVTLLGPNGCGKSTLIKIMLGLLSPARGSISLNGKNIRHVPPQIAR